MWRPTYDVHEGDGHGSDERAEEGLQLPESVVLEEQEGEGVGARDEDARPDWHPWEQYNIPLDSCNTSEKQAFNKNVCPDLDLAMEKNPHAL